MKNKNIEICTPKLTFIQGVLLLVTRTKGFPIDCLSPDKILIERNITVGDIIIYLGIVAWYRPI